MTDTRTCPRNDCEEQLRDDQLAEDMHLATEHDSRREEIDNYPRSPSER